MFHATPSYLQVRWRSDVGTHTFSVRTPRVPFTVLGAGLPMENVKSAYVAQHLFGEQQQQYTTYPAQKRGKIKTESFKREKNVDHSGISASSLASDVNSLLRAALPCGPMIDVVT